MREIHILSGIPGSGKSTWAVAQAAGPWYQDGAIAPKPIYLSRDDFRADLRFYFHSTKYFPVSSKKEFRLWIANINNSLALDPNMPHIIDQTTIGAAAFLKLYCNLQLCEEDSIILHIFNTPLATCLERNAARRGFSRVPEKTIRLMAAGPGVQGSRTSDLWYQDKDIVEKVAQVVVHGSRPPGPGCEGEARTESIG